jgi:hypothetical protein
VESGSTLFDEVKALKSIARNVPNCILRWIRKGGIGVPSLDYGLAKDLKSKYLPV